MILADSEPTRLHAAGIIRRGGVVAFRTDTFYGLGADPFNLSAIKQIKDLKGREAGKPILIVISDRDQAARFIAEASQTFELLARAFWPGPLTLIGKARPQLSDEITAGTGTVGVRLPDDQDARALIRSCGGSLTATSANPSASQPATSAQEVEDYFGSRIDLTVDGGAARTDRPSTVVDAVGAAARLIREGVISMAELNRELVRHGFERLGTTD